MKFRTSSTMLQIITLNKRKSNPNKTKKNFKTTKNIPKRKNQRW